MICTISFVGKPADLSSPFELPNEAFASDQRGIWGWTLRYVGFRTKRGRVTLDSSRAGLPGQIGLYERRARTWINLRQVLCVTQVPAAALWNTEATER
jgi:hypothetical protein